ncbi:hypothetical protein JCM12141A_57730 [Mycolicibacterium hodleri]
MLGLGDGTVLFAMGLGYQVVVALAREAGVDYLFSFAVRHWRTLPHCSFALVRDRRLMMQVIASRATVLRDAREMVPLRPYRARQAPIRIASHHALLLENWPCRSIRGATPRRS